MKVYSVFNIEGYGNELVQSKIPSELERIICNEFDVEKFRCSLEEHQRERKSLVPDSSIDQFNEIIDRVGKRSERLKPFNKGLIKALKYGDSWIMTIGPVRKMLVRDVEGYTTEGLVGKYCDFFDEQAEDFGGLFYHVIERESGLVDYSNHLIERNQFYAGQNGMLKKLVSSTESKKNEISSIIRGVRNISSAVRKSLLNRASMKGNDVKASLDIVRKLTDENEMAIAEVDGLLNWCGGMKNVLALSKERMDNYALHMRETLTAYLQAVSLNRSFRETNTAISGLIEVMTAAQSTADEGVKDLIKFVRTNGIYSRPIRGVFGG